MTKIFSNSFLLFKRLLLIYLLYLLCRLVFIVFNPVYLQSGLSNILLSFYYGLRFDVSAIIYTNGLFIVLSILPLSINQYPAFQKLLKLLFVVVNTVAIILNLIDTGYIVFSGKRSGIEIFTVAGDNSNVFMAYLKDFWYLLLILFALVGIMIKYYPQDTYNQKNSLLDYKQWLQFLAILALAVIGARGGIRLIPINTFDAARMLNSKMVPAVVNTPFNMLMSVQQKGLQKVNFYTDAILETIYSPVFKAKVLVEPNTQTPKNIVLIIVESLGKEYVGKYNLYKGYTPFIDSLMQYSVVYNHAYANGKKSIEGIPAIMAAMPSLMQTDYVSSFYQTNTLNSIGSTLQKIGYNSSFYHGGKNGTMGFDNFLALTNNGQYFGLNQYPNEKDFDGKWGIYDEPYLKYFANELNPKEKPFFSTVFTLSSHHPYAIPNVHKNKFNKGTLPIHEAIGYTDYALQEFFKTAQNMPWFNNTVFIITADHSAENEMPYYQTSAGKFEIPLLVFEPNRTDTVKAINETFQQTDIYKLILDKVTFSDNFFAFGSNQKPFAIQYTDSYYQLIQWPWVYQLSADNFMPLALYNQQDDELLKQNLIKKLSLNNIAAHLDSLTKAIIQQYNNRLIKNTTN